MQNTSDYFQLGIGLGTSVWDNTAELAGSQSERPETMSDQVEMTWRYAMTQNAVNLAKAIKNIASTMNDMKGRDEYMSLLPGLEKARESIIEGFFKVTAELDGGVVLDDQKGWYWEYRKTKPFAEIIDE
jgi:hypothetical protein